MIPFASLPQPKPGTPEDRARFDALCLWIEHGLMRGAVPEGIDREWLAARLAGQIMLHFSPEALAAVVKQAAEFCDWQSPRQETPSID